MIPSRGGLLGHGGFGDELLPRRIEKGFEEAELPIFIAIDAGTDHSIALDVHGHIWTFGWGGTHLSGGRYGALGHGLRDNEYRPRRIEGGYYNIVLPRFISITAGGSSHSDRSMAICNQGNIWVWGHGTLGHESGVGGIGRPKKITGIIGFGQIVGVSTLHGHNMAVDSRGHVWTWGQGHDGRLGHGLGSENRPRRIEDVINFVNMVAVSAGSDHSLSLDSQGNMWAWGNNSGGQLGHERLT